MLFKNKSKKLVLSRFFLLAPILVISIAFQAKEPVLSDLQVPSFEDNGFIEVFQTDTTGTVFTEVEESPVPPGGINGFMKSIADNYVYPQEAREANVKGRIILTFIVEVDGQLGDIKVVKDLGYGTGEEAIRALENSPKWKPGVQNGKSVRVKYTLPIMIGQESKLEAPTQPSTSSAAQSSPNIIVEDPSPLFSEVEQKPVPLDGMTEFLKYIGENYVYPEAAVEAKVSGRIILVFVVEKDGSLSEIKSVRDLGYGTGEEAIRVLKAGPKWKPGVQNGEFVRVQYVLPVILDLSK